MKIASLLSTIVLTSMLLAAPTAVFAADAACVKKEQAKGASACIAKAKCDGITSKKQQAKLCS